MTRPLFLFLSKSPSFCKVKCDLSLSLSPSRLWGAAPGSVSETLRLFVAGRTDGARRGAMSRGSEGIAMSGRTSQSLRGSVLIREKVLAGRRREQGAKGGTFHGRLGFFPRSRIRIDSKTSPIHKIGSSLKGTVARRHHRERQPIGRGRGTTGTLLHRRVRL